MPLGKRGSSSHSPSPSASVFTSRTTPGGPRMTSGSCRGGTVVYFSAYTSIGSSAQWSGWKWDKTTWRSEEHTSELQSQSNLVCRLLLEKKKKQQSESAD